MLNVICGVQVARAPAELQTLPNLHILVVRHLCTVGHLLHVRWAPQTLTRRKHCSSTA